MDIGFLYIFILYIKMNFSAGHDFGDRRKIIQDDDAFQRQIAIQNMKRAETEAKAIWQERQMELYPSGLKVSGTPTLQQVLIEENNKSTKDEQTNYDRAMSNLQHLATKETAGYILDRLSPEQIFAMNLQWNAVLLRVKKNYTKTGLDKDVFVAMVKTLEDPFYETHKTTEDYPSERARNRMLQESEEGELLQKNIDAKKEMESLTEQAGIRRTAEKQRKKDEEETANRGISFLTEMANEKKRADKKNRELYAEPADDEAVEIEKAKQGGLQRNLLLEQAGDKLSNTLDAGARNVYVRDGVGQILTTPVKGVLSPIPSSGRKGKSLMKKNLMELQEHVHDLYKTMDAIYDANGKKLTKTQLIDKVNQFTGKSPVQGTGLKVPKKQRVIIGGGMTPTAKKQRTIANKKIINGKYLDMNKFKNNILCVRYVSTGGYIPQLKSQMISQATREVIEDILGDKFDERLYKKLTADERRIIKRFVKVFNIQVNVKDDDDVEFNKQFEILRGEFLAGNDNPEIKDKLKKYVVEAVAEGKIPRHQGYSLLFQLSI